MEEEKILAHADEFIAIDSEVNDIVSWGEQELKSRESVIRSSGGSLADFKKVAAEVEQAIKSKLQILEEETRERYQQN